MAWYRCGMNGTYNATTVSRSGAVCNYVANVGGVPLSRFIANITPIQADGTPSPSNPLPITGWSAVNVARTGKNLWSKGDISGTRRTSVTVDIKAGTYTLSANVTSSDTNYNYNNITFIYEDGTTEIVYINRGSRQSVTFTLSKNVTSIYFYASRGYDASADDTFSFTDIQLELGSTATSYHAYTGQTVTINLNGTYYGGTLNVGTGVLTVTHVNIASYNGESINEPWLCSEAPYIPNTTPPTGSQVVYPLTTPQTYQLTPAQIEQLLGENNVWCDSGDSEVDFFKIIRT